MRTAPLALLIALCSAAPVMASTDNPAPLHNTATASQADNILARIEDKEWTLRHSSMVGAIDDATRQASLDQLSRARSELAAGNLRTADELARRAALPLVQMEPTARMGKHPDAQDRLGELRSTLNSIIPAAEKIAREAAAPTGFADQARSALAQADVLASSGQHDAAYKMLEQTYTQVQVEVARLRSGQTFFLSTPTGYGEPQWADGLRRFEERRMLTQYLILEAQAEGVDPTPLHSGLQAAERTLAEATAQAGTQRWDSALQKLEVAYVQFEDSWKQVGIDW